MKKCACCGKQFEKRAREEPKRFAKRKFCSCRCNATYHNRKPFSVRLAAQVNRNGPVPKHAPSLGSCWEWSGTFDKHRYGTYIDHGKVHRAHRKAWEFYHGKPPGEKCVCHRCDNPSCVRKSHLFLGTQLDNIADMRRKERHSNPPPQPGVRNVKAKLRESDVRTIRRNAASGTPCKELAKRFGVNVVSIRAAVKRKTWRHLP